MLAIKTMFSSSLKSCRHSNNNDNDLFVDLHDIDNICYFFQRNVAIRNKVLINLKKATKYCFSVHIFAEVVSLCSSLEM